MSSIDNVTDGRTYTFGELEQVAGAAFANRARQLAGVEVPAPAPRPRAPRRAAGSNAKIPRRAGSSGRIGDRLSRS